ncbi:hypothetical protein ACP70R_024864 [Stipagrostis hirtigluma subsp. patula]
MGSKVLFLLLASLVVSARATTTETQISKESSAAGDLLLTAAEEQSWPPPADAVVSAQPEVGGRHFSTVEKALAAAPEGGHRYVVSVKASIYEEYLIITRHNIVLTVEGIGKTIPGTRAMALKPR